MSLLGSHDTEAVNHGLACFTVADAPFSVNIRLVREINAHLDLTPVHGVSPFVLGLVNLRGQVVTVIDLAERLGIGHSRIGPESRLVVLKTNVELAVLDDCELETSDDKIGLLVDRIADVVTPEPPQLEPPPPNLGGVAVNFLAGVCKTGEHTMGVLDLGNLLESASVDSEAAAGGIGDSDAGAGGMSPLEPQ